MARGRGVVQNVTRPTLIHSSLLLACVYDQHSHKARGSNVGRVLFLNDYPSGPEIAAKRQKGMEAGPLISTFPYSFVSYTFNVHRAP